MARPRITKTTCLQSLLSSGTRGCTPELNPHISLCLESQQELCAESSAPLTPHWCLLPNPHEMINPFQEQQYHWRCTSSTHILRTEAVSKQLLQASQVLQLITDLNDFQLLSPNFFFKSQTYILVPKRSARATMFPRKCFFVLQCRGR